MPGSWRIFSKKSNRALFIDDDISDDHEITVSYDTQVTPENAGKG
jgi:hypothetical protein